MVIKQPHLKMNFFLERETLCILKLFLTTAEKVSRFRNKKLHNILVSWFFDLVGKFASWKLKNESYFPNHDTLIRTLCVCICCRYCCTFFQTLSRLIQRNIFFLSRLFNTFDIKCDVAIVIINSYNSVNVTVVSALTWNNQYV